MPHRPAERYGAYLQNAPANRPSRPRHASVQGMEVLQKILEFDPGIDVILMTGYYSTESAVEAIQKGAADYFPKPFPPTSSGRESARLKRIRNIASAA